MLVPGNLARSAHRPDSPVGMVLCRTDDNKITLWLASGKRATFLEAALVPAAADAVPEDSFLAGLLAREREALNRVPELLHAELRRVWYSKSLDGGARRTKSAGDDASGSDGQKTNGALLREHGIRFEDPRFEQVRKFGSWLYDGAGGVSAAAPVAAARPSASAARASAAAAHAAAAADESAADESPA
jgi:hypothetical protein